MSERRHEWVDPTTGQRRITNSEWFDSAEPDHPETMACREIIKLAAELEQAKLEREEDREAIRKVVETILSADPRPAMTYLAAHWMDSPAVKRAMESAE